MRYFFSSIFMLFLIIGFGNPVGHAWNDEPIISINGERLLISQNDFILYEGITFVPYAPLLKALDARMRWNQETKQLLVTKEDKLLRFDYVNNSVHVSGRKDSSATVLKKNDTLYIPLRLTATLLSKETEWDKRTNTFYIRNRMKQTGITMYVNHTRLPLNHSLKMIKGRTMISLKDLHYLFIKTEWDVNQDLLIIRNNRQFITYSPESSWMNVNGHFILDSHFLSYEKGIPYVPLRFVTTHLGGKLHKSRKNIYVSFQEPVIKSDVLVKRKDKLTEPKDIPSVDGIGNTTLFVSDHPEMIDHAALKDCKGLLWKEDVSSSSENKTHRIYGYHVNKCKTPLKILLTIENRNGESPLEYRHLFGINKTSKKEWDLFRVGIPIAEAALLHEHRNTEIQYILPNEKVVIATQQVLPEQLVSFIHDIQVKPIKNEQVNYTIRTVAVPASSEENVLLPDHITNINQKKLHPRGSWGYATLQTELPTYFVGTSPKAYRLSNGRTDHQYTEESSENPMYAVANPGHFGATYRIQIPFVNSTNKLMTVEVKLGARGGIYAGAVKTSKGVQVIPMLHPNKEVVTIGTYKINPGKKKISFELMHAGGSFLPISIEVHTVNLKK